MAKKVSVGAELELLVFNLRAGLNQGYIAAGFGMDFGLFKFDVATYGVELGVYAGQQQDRRYMAQMSMELDFDPLKYFGGGHGSGSGSGAAGGSGASGGGRIRLKQRR
jgi:hypothetical protein